MDDRTRSSNPARLLAALVAALLLGFVATSAGGAPIQSGFTPASSQAQLAFDHLALFAPVDTQAGSPFFAPIDAGLAVRTPAPVSHGFAGSSGVVSFNALASSVDTGSIPDTKPPGQAVPEPAGALLFAAGFALVALRSRRS